VDELAAGIPGLRVVRGGDLRVRLVRVDSRRVGTDDLFVAVQGAQYDAMTFAAEALARGATGVVGSQEAEPPASGAWLVADDPRRAAALLADRAWDHPSGRLDVLGVTGTNGKTTTTFLARAILEHAGTPTAIVGTLGAYLPGRDHRQERTTPEAPELQETLAAAADAGAGAVAIEVSSHALDLARVDGTFFAAAAFLNLTPEHLDWHGTMEAYAAAKRRLFAELLGGDDAARGPRAVLSADDPRADEIGAGRRALRFGLAADADVGAEDIRRVRGGVEFRLRLPDTTLSARLPLPGDYNLSNALAAAALAWTIGVPGEAIAGGLAEAQAPPGRFERVFAGSFDAWVDYAHTEDGVRRALEVARGLGGGRVIAVIGCGGDRDRTKRPVMGGVVAQACDVAVFTSDNPRTEDPAAIIDDMLGGVADRGKVEVELDRERALARAVELARPGDVVIALGKGHEEYQEIAGVKHHFPERSLLARLGAERDGEAGGGRA
jgi:UDP-N-acetylmuramoyl-L-alanyl-D-glutamate--2,6-diaminopimelate ligase